MKLAQNRAKLTEIATKGSKPVAKFNFTKKAIEHLVSGEKRAYFYDEQVRGLALAVDPTGRKTFLLYRKVQGRPERVKIGTFPDMSIEGARTQAQGMNVVIAQGGNPAQERRAVRAEMTLQELLDTFLLLYAKEHKRTWKNDQWTFDRYLHGWKLKKLSSIRRADVVDLHRHIGRTHGKYIANRVVELLSSMFNRARRDWGYEGANPAEKISPFKERKRARFLDGNELPAFFKSLAQEGNETIRDYILVSLLTGGRRGNVESMRWDEIDWTRSEWNISAEKAKADEPITVVLTPAVVEILARRKADSLKASAHEGSEPNEWVFPGVGKTGHLVEPKTAWKRILERARNIEREDWLQANPTKTEKNFAEYKPVPSFTDLRLHDLRRTLGSWQAATGASLPIIGKSLGHSSIQATQIYARLNLDPVRDAVNKATDAMLIAGNATALLGDGQ
jgi:integrase